MGFGLITLLTSVATAGNSDPRIERLERLERALQIEDCEYAVSELEYLNMDYKDVALRFSLLAEGYLCLGKPEKAKMAIAEFAKLGGQANQLSIRVQEFCALQSCGVQPVLVKPVRQEDLRNARMTTVETQPPTIPKVQSAVRTTEAPVEVPVDVKPKVVEPVVEAQVAESKVVEPKIVEPKIVEPKVVEQPTQVVEPVERTVVSAEKPTAEVVNVRIEPKITPSQPIEAATSAEVAVSGDGVQAETSPTISTESLSKLAEIQGFISDGQCADAAVMAKELAIVETNNSGVFQTLGDAIACYPEGSGDIFTAFDAWMIAKELGTAQNPEADAIQSRLSWALERSGIVKVIPEYDSGFSSWPEGFSIAVESDPPVDLTRRTDHLAKATYVTNLPLGKVTVRITPGGARPDIVEELIVQPGKLQKIVVPIGPEKHIRLPAFPSPDGYEVVLVGSDKQPLLYTPSQSRLIPKDQYAVTVQYRAKTYSFPFDATRYSEINSEERIAEDLRALLPWVYLLRDTAGTLLVDGMVFPDQQSTEVMVDLGTVSYLNWRDGVPIAEDERIHMLTGGTVVELEESLFNEVVLDVNSHPFYETANELYIAEEEWDRTLRSSVWLKGAVIGSAIWTATSMAMDATGQNPELWRPQSTVSAMLTVPLFGVLLHERVRVKPMQHHHIMKLMSILETLDNDLIPLSELQEGAVQTSLLERMSQDSEDGIDIEGESLGLDE